jgi:hypothetical protein
MIHASNLESRVVMRFYEAVDHFTRHIEIPNVRLSDWLGSK